MAGVEGVMASNHTRSHMAGVEETMDSVTHGVAGDTPAETRPNNSAIYAILWVIYPTIAQTNPVAVVIRTVTRPRLAAPRSIFVPLFSACLSVSSLL